VVLLLIYVLVDLTANKSINHIINTIILISRRRGFFCTTCRPNWWRL